MVKPNLLQPFKFIWGVGWPNGNALDCNARGHEFQSWPRPKKTRPNAYYSSDAHIAACENKINNPQEEAAAEQRCQVADKLLSLDALRLKIIIVEQ